MLLKIWRKSVKGTAGWEDLDTWDYLEGLTESHAVNLVGSVRLDQNHQVARYQNPHMHLFRDGTL
jgi:enhancing lycopene biosynthesis protein 2